MQFRIKLHPETKKKRTFTAQKHSPHHGRQLFGKAIRAIPSPESGLGKAEEIREKEENKCPAKTKQYNSRY